MLYLWDDSPPIDVPAVFFMERSGVLTENLSVPRTLNDAEITAISSANVLFQGDPANCVDVMILNSGFIVSQKLADLLASFGKLPIQLVPLKFVQEDMIAIDIGRYYLLSIHSPLDAIIREETEYFWEKNGTFYLTNTTHGKRVVDGRKIEGHHLWRDVRAPMYPFVSEDLKTEFEAQDISGCSFRRTCTVQTQPTLIWRRD